MIDPLDTKIISVTNVPTIDLEFLKPYARRQGFSEQGATLVRYAVIELARRIRAENGSVEQSGHRQAVQ